MEISQRAALFALFDAAREVARTTPWATCVQLHEPGMVGAGAALIEWAGANGFPCRDQLIAGNLARMSNSPDYINLICGPVTVLHYREATEDEPRNTFHIGASK